MSLTDSKVKNAKPSEKVVKLTDWLALYVHNLVRLQVCDVWLLIR